MPPKPRDTDRDIRAATRRDTTALTGRSDLDSIGGLPAAWICDSADSASRLAAARPDLIGAPAEPVAGYSFVGLGGTAVDEVGVRAAQVFRDFLQQPAQQTAFKS